MANNVCNNNVNPAIVVEVGEQNANNYGQYSTNIEIAEPQQKISEQQQQQTVPEDEKAQSAVPPASTKSGRKRKKGQDASSRKSSGEEKVFTCKYCDKSFPSAQCLGGHMNAHYSQRKQDKVKGAIELLLSQGGPAAARLISASASKRRKPGVPYPAVPLFQNMLHGTGGIMPCTDNNNNVSSTSSAAGGGVGHVQNYYNFPAMQFPSSSQAQMLFPNSTNVVTRAQPQAHMLLPNSPNVVLQAQPQAQAPPHNNITPNMKLGQPPLQRHMVNKNMINMNVNMATGSNSVHPPAVTSSSPVGMVTSGYSLQNPNNNNSSLRTTSTNPCYRAPSSTAFMNCIHSHNNNHSPCPTCIQFQARLLKQPNFNPDLGVAKHPSKMMMMKMKMENMNSNTSSGNTRASSQQQHYSTVMVPHSMHQKSNNHNNVIINTQSGSSSLQQIPMPMPIAAFLPSQCQSKSQSQGNAAVQEQSQSQSPWVNTKEAHTHTSQQQQHQAEDIIKSYHEYSPSEHDSLENPALQILQPIAAFLPSQCQSKSQSQGSAAVQEQSQSQSPCVNAKEAHTHTSQQQQQEAEDIIKSYHEYSPSEHDSLENPAGIPARFDTDHGEEDWTALIDSFF